VVNEVADEIGATPTQIGLAWLLTHSPNTLLIPGTRSIAHLEQNMAAGDITLTADSVARLDAVGDHSPRAHGIEPFVSD
jgi:aryl-alcohol dehydrogenase-like predicted oxidoreductase